MSLIPVLALLACTPEPLEPSSRQPGVDAMAADQFYGDGACGGTATTWLWDDASQAWILAPGSVQASMECVDQYMATVTTLPWTGQVFEEGPGATLEEWEWSDGSLAHRTLLLWDGGIFVLAEGSTRLVYDYEDGRVRNTVQERWDVASQSWQVAPRDHGTPSVLTEYDWDGDQVGFTQTKLYDPVTSFWNLEVGSVRSQRSYQSDLLDHTLTEFYDGSQWNVGWESEDATSVRATWSWGQDGRLQAVETTTWSEEVGEWILDGTRPWCISTRTQYQWNDE